MSGTNLCLVATEISNFLSFLKKKQEKPQKHSIQFFSVYTENLNNSNRLKKERRRAASRVADY